MTEVTIPVDLRNPGQVFACLGLMEAAKILIPERSVEGNFSWRDGKETFSIQTGGKDNPVEIVLDFLAAASIAAGDRPDWRGTKKKKDEDGAEPEINGGAELRTDSDNVPLVQVPAPLADAMALPLVLGGGNQPQVILTHWTDGSSRDDFKLYAGNRTGVSIARAMLQGVVDKKGKRKTDGLAQLWRRRRPELAEAPFDVLTPVAGTFNFDPRRAWTAIDAGYSPDQQGHLMIASPAVEILAAWGLEHTRPNEFELRRVRYAVWRERLPLLLARPALAGALPLFSARRFRFHLELAGKNKVVGFAQEEIDHD
jgi:CRISPR-associated protein Csx14